MNEAPSWVPPARQVLRKLGRSSAHILPAGLLRKLWSSSYGVGLSAAEPCAITLRVVEPDCAPSS